MNFRIITQAKMMFKKYSFNCKLSIFGNYNSVLAQILIEDRSLASALFDIILYRGSPAYADFWDFKKPTLPEICVSGTVGGPLLTLKSPTCAYISQKLR